MCTSGDEGTGHTDVAPGAREPSLFASLASAAEQLKTDRAVLHVFLGWCRYPRDCSIASIQDTHPHHNHIAPTANIR